MKKNCYIQFLRFLFCVAIINYHFYSHYLINGRAHFFCRGYIADEFFFIVSGFYFAKFFLDNAVTDNLYGIKYLLKRIKKISIPYYLCWLFSFVGIHIIANKINNGTLQDISGQISQLNLSDSLFKDVANSIYEICFLDMFGFKKGLYCNTVAWYFSAVIISFMLILPFCGRFFNKYGLYISPFISVFLYACLSLNYDYLYAPHTIVYDFPIPIYKGMLRAFAGVNIGVYFASLYNCFSIAELFKKYRYLFTVLVACIWTGVFAYCIYPFSSNSDSVLVQFDYIVTIFIAIGLFIVFGLDPFTNANCHVKTVINKLGDLSMFSFFAQSILYANDNYLFSLKYSTITTFVLFNIIAFALAVIIMFLSNLFKKILIKKKGLV